MHPQLVAIQEDFAGASSRLDKLEAAMAGATWTRRPAPERWSPAECIAHLNLSAQAMLPLIDKALAEARAVGGRPPSRYHRDVLGWILWKTLGPPVRFRTRTPAPFVPQADVPIATLLAEFRQLQREQVARVWAADGLPLASIYINSPFAAGAKYNVYACLSILPRHEHRHLWQAERAAEVLRRKGALKPRVRR
jgi:hypothetical protein